MNGKQAKRIWDALIYIKIKNPSFDVKEHVQRVELVMTQFKNQEKKPTGNLELVTPILR